MSPSCYKIIDQVDQMSILIYNLCISLLLFQMKFSWHIILRMKAPKEGVCDPIAPLELPHSLHAFHRVSSSDELNKVSLFPSTCVT